MIKNNIILFIISLMLFGCSSVTINKEDKIETSANVPVARPAPAPVPVTVAPPAAKENIVLYRAFLLPTNVINENQFVNFIYFPRKPITKKEFDQYVFICKVWSLSLPSKDEASIYSKTNNLIPLYWSIVKSPTTDSCGEFVMQYDYTRMKMIVNKNKLDANKIQLLGLYNDIYVSMNLTKVTKEEDIILAFDVWRAKLSTIPEKSSKIDIFTVVDSAKKVLGALSGLIITGFKG
jgi:hypothetical protein